MADISTSNWTNLLNNSMELEDTVTLGSKVGVMARPVSREDTKSNNDPTSGLTDILLQILGSFSGDVKDLEETKVNSRDVADEVYSKYDILEPIEDPAKARRIGGLTTKNLPMPVNAPVGRQRFSIFPEAAEEVAEEVVEDKVVDGLMRDPRKLGGSEGYGSLGKPEKDGDGLMSKDTRNLGGAEGYGSLGVSNTTAPDRGLIPALSSNVVFSDPEMSFIVALEQFREKPYELNSNTNLSPTEHKSGLTIANGFDVGQHSKKVLEDMGLSTTTINKFSEWIGVNPDTIIDPITNAPAATRVRGHELMAEKFETARANGTLPDLSYKELEEVAKGSYDVLGTQVAKSAYGAGFEQLDDAVKAVLTQEAYVRGKINQTSIDRARNGEDALRVLDAMPSTGHLANRKSNVRSWLSNNTFSDDKALSNQGIQMITNIIIEDSGLQITPLVVDSLVGPATRRTVNEVIRASGKTPPSAGSTGDARRKELLEEIANESLLPTPATS